MSSPLSSPSDIERLRKERDSLLRRVNQEDDLEDVRMTATKADHQADLTRLQRELVQCTGELQQTARERDDLRQVCCCCYLHKWRDYCVFF